MQYYDLATMSLVGGSGIVEARIPLLFGDGSFLGGTSSTTAGSNFIADDNGSNKTVHILNSKWSPSTQFAFEATIYANTSGTAYAALWDLTSNSLVSASQVSTSSGTAIVVRSGKFSLTAGHSLGVTTWISTSSQNVDIIDASLIVFP